MLILTLTPCYELLRSITKVVNYIRYCTNILVKVWIWHESRLSAWWYAPSARCSGSHIRNLHRHSIMKPGRVRHWAESRDSLPSVLSITDLIVKLILKFIPVKGPYSLSLDRTNWKFSDTNINILTWDVQAEKADWDDVQRAQEQWLQHWRLSHQNPRTYCQSICYRNACICLVLPRWYLYSRKHQEDKGSVSWQKSQKPLQIQTGVYRTVPPEPHEPLSDRYFQIIVIYLGFKITFYIFATETDNWTYSACHFIWWIDTTIEHVVFILNICF